MNRLMIIFTFATLSFTFANYQIKSSVLGASGGTSNSQNYNLVSTAGENIVGVSNSSNFIVIGGYSSAQPEEYAYGDINMDGFIDVADIVLLINFIVYADQTPDDTEFNLSDLNSDGLLNVLDIVMIMDIILGHDLARENPTHEVSLSYGNGIVNYKSDGKLAGIQLEVIGDFEITDNHLPDGWEIANSENTIILYALDGSSLTEKTLFEYKGDLTIESAIAADWHGSEIQVNSLLIPRDFTLSPAYPNPFNPVTTLRFDLDYTSKVNLTVYNILGNEIITLQNGELQAGRHAIQWNASNAYGQKFPSGLYLYKVTSDSRILTGKMLLMK